MTALLPALGRRVTRGRGRIRVRRLGDGDLADLRRLVGTDPIVNAVIDARLTPARSLQQERLGAEVLGVRRDGELVAACLHGGNLITIGTADPVAWGCLAGALRARPRRCSAIVGRADAVGPLWAAIGAGWPPARDVRAGQPLLVTDRLADGLLPVPPALVVRQARLADLEQYAAAAAAMFTEELGVTPHAAAGTDGFRTRLTQLISSGRAFAVFDAGGRVVFKADLAAVTAHTCQIQGVWVRPELRDRGLGTAALGAVLQHALGLAPTVSLYVNDFNHRARRVYAKLGMRQIASLTTVLL